MRIIVCPARLEVGGSQITALESAVAVRDLGHEVIVFGQPGSLVDRIAAAGLEFVPAPRPGQRPCPRMMRALRRLVSQRSADVVHAYEWTTALEAYWGPRARMGVPAVGTVMSMAVVPFLPHDLPLVVGTEQIADHERRAGRSDVTVIEPAVDTERFSVGAVDDEGFRRQHGLDPDALTIACVTRLTTQLKLEGLLTAIDVVADADRRAQLVIAGDGPARVEIAARAEAANARAGRHAVVLAGELGDPRPVFAAADVCLGMGASALQAMAFARPLVVQGERGFWQVLTPDTTEQFLWTGWYGIGDGEEHGAARLRGLLAELLADAGLRAHLGAQARRLVEERFSLRAAGERQVELYRRTLARAPVARRDWMAAGTASVPGLAAYRIRSRVDQVTGRLTADRLRPVAAVAPLRACEHSNS